MSKENFLLYVVGTIIVAAITAIQTIVQEWIRTRKTDASHEVIAEKVAKRMASLPPKARNGKTHEENGES